MKTVNFRKGTKNGLQDVKETQRELPMFTKITRIPKTAKIRKDLRGTKTANISRGTKKGLKDVRGTQQEL